MTDSILTPPQQFARLIRVNDWWTFKLAPIVGTAYATAAIFNPSLISLWRTFLFLLVALGIGASYACVINNLCDRHEDQLSGKSNYFIGRSRRFMALVVILCCGLGLIVMGQLIQAPLVLAAYLGNWFLFTVYSVAPIRLKKRGIWGVIAITVAETCGPQLFAMVLVAHDVGQPLPITWFAIIAIWSFAMGLRCILWHQILDFENDLQAGVNTFAVNASVPTLQKLGKWVIFPIEVVSFLGILLSAHNLFAWGFLGLYAVTEWLRYYFWNLAIVIVTPTTTNHRVVLFEYYDTFYPLAFLCIASWQNSLNLILLGVHLLLYSQRLGWWMRDSWGLLRWEIPNRLQSRA